MKYPVGIQQFDKLRQEKYVYIDKTHHIYDLVENGCYYFLSRPRRFGKSLLLSTIEAYFSGKRELFEGLAIAEKEQNWYSYPILHLDLNSQKYDSVEALESILNNQLSQWEALYGASATEDTLSLRFGGVIRRAAQKCGRNVVILIDEYDKPLLQAYGNQALLDEYRSTLKAFYGNLKSSDGYIKFAMLTGVTKFGKVSVFSDLNSLMDISMDPRYTDICGISNAEMQHYFSESIQELAEAQSMSLIDACRRIKDDYDGYRFHPKSEGVYNPFSVLNTFAKKEFGDYWFETGTPTLLVKMLRESDYELSNLTKEEVSTDTLDCIFDSDNPVPVIFQSGYLTISGYDSEFGLYSLRFPNREVKQGFLRFLLPYYTQVTPSMPNGATSIAKFISDLRNGRIDDFMVRLRSLFADTSYILVRGEDLERHYHNVIYLITKLMGFYTISEYCTLSGRIDMLVKTPDYTYLFEFKLDGSAEEALEQIERKDYSYPFESDGSKIVKIGANFSSESKSLESWLIK